MIAKMYKSLIKLSLYFTNTGLLPLSPLASLMGGLLLIGRILTLPKLYKFEFVLLLFFFYFIISATIFYPFSLLEYGFYRYDGNFIISYLPIFALAFYRPIVTEDVLKKFLLLSSTVYFLYYLFWILTKGCSFGGVCSFGGFYEARNATGGFLSILLTISIIFWMHRIKTFKIISMILLVMLVSTISRGSMMGVFVSMFVYFIFINKNKMIDKILFLFFFIITISVALFLYDSSFDYTNESAIVEKIVDSETTIKEANVLIRANYLFPKAIEIFYNNPILGAGVGSFNDYGNNIKDIQTYSSSHAHNSFLHFLAEVGLIGFIIFMLFVYLFRRFWLKNRYKNVLLADAAYFSFLTVLFASFTEHRITTPASMIIVSILIGAFISQVRFKSNANN